jgi:hypothetical protein
MMVAAIQQRDAYGVTGEPSCRAEAGEAAADDHDVRRGVVRHVSHLRVYYRP